MATSMQVILHGSIYRGEEKIMYKLTVLLSYQAKQYESMTIGDIVELRYEKDNQVDENAIAVYIDNTKIGYVANAAETVLEGTLPAKRLKRLVTDSRTKKTMAIFQKEEAYQNKAGELQKRFLASAFFVPMRSHEKEATEPFLYTVGGTAAEHTKKNAVKGMMQKQQENGEKVNVPIVVLKTDMGGQIRYKVHLPDCMEPGQSSGEIIDGDDRMEEIFNRNASIHGHAVKDGEKGSYKIELLPNVQKIEEFYPYIDSAIEQCIDQANTLEEKVSLMLSQGVPDIVIQDVLKQMPVGTEIEKPRTTYYQSKGGHLADLLSYMLLSKPVRLVGSKGTGKNTLIETACWLLKRPFYRVQGNPELDKTDIQGSKYLLNGNTGTELSAILTTLRDDGIVVLDEVNAVQPGILLMLNSLTDGSRSINVEGCGTIKMGQHACIIYTMNENYIGTEEMNASTLDRVPGIFLESESDLGALLKHIVPGATQSDIQTCVKVAADIEKAIEEGNLSDDARTTRGYIDALEAIRYIPLKRGLIENVANKAQSASERVSMSVIISNLCV